MALEIFKLMGTVAISKDKALKDIKAIQDQAQKASTAMGKSFTKFSGYVEKHSAQIKKAGKYMTVFGGIATAAFALSVKSAANFETQLANVSTMLDESAMKILPEYRKGLQSLSVDFGESTETLSKGLYDILSASIPPAEALGVLEVSAKAAAAGITDTGVAADAITTILNSYGLSADQAGMVSDKLFAIVKGGKTTFAELAPSIGKVAATASMAGLSFDDLGACIATMTRAGIRTEETMTAINGVLIAFLKPTDEAIEAAAKFGLTLDTNTLKTEGLTGVMDKLKDATAEQLAAIFPNIRGLKGMAAALGDAEGYARDYALMLDSAGLTQEAFAKQSATLNFKLGQLKEMFNVIKVTVGTALIPAVENLIKRGMEILKNVKEWTEANKPLTETIVKWAAGISLLLLGLGPLLMMLPGIVAGVGLLFGHFTAFVATGALIAVVAGVMKLSEYLRETVGGMRKFREELGKMKLEEVEEQISELTDTLNQLQKRFYEIPKGIGRQQILTMIDEINKRLGDLYKRREELMYLEEKGVGLTYNEIKAREEIEARIKEEEEAIKALIEERKDEIEGVIELLKGNEKLAGQMKILTAEYELTNKTIEDTNKYYQKMLELSKELVRELELEVEKTKEGTAERDEAILKLLAQEKVTKDLKEAIEELNKAQDLQLKGLELTRVKLELLELRYEEIEKDVGYYKEKLQLLKEEHELLVKNLDEVIKKYGEGTEEYYKALAAIIANENEMKKWWKEIDKGAETVDEFATAFADKMLMAKGVAVDFGDVTVTLWEKWKTFFDNLKEKYGTTLTILQDGISGFVSSFQGAISNAITSLFTMAETNAKIKEDMAKLEEEYTDEMATLQEEYNQAVIAGDDAAAENALQNIADLKEEHEQAMQDMSDDMVTKEDIWKTFWGNIKTAAINALAEIIAKQAISVLLSWGWAGWLLLGLAFIYSLIQSWGKALGGEVTKQAMALGGEVAKFAKGGLFKGLQVGGLGTDTVPAMLTPGEYVVSAPMVDFIKRTGVVTGDLIRSIQMGSRTPMPAFALGGQVGGPVITREMGSQVNIEEISVSIFAQELNDETIANAGDKMFVELKKQFDMRGLVLMEG